MFCKHPCETSERNRGRTLWRISKKNYKKKPRIEIWNLKPKLHAFYRTFTECLFRVPRLCLKIRRNELMKQIFLACFEALII